MFTDYKYSYIIQDDVKNTTVALVRVYEGDYETTDVKLWNAEKQKTETVTVTVYKRTTSLEDPLEEYKLEFDGVLSKEELDKQVNKIVKDIADKKTAAKEMLVEQQELPTEVKLPKVNEKLK